MMTWKRYLQTRMALLVLVGALIGLLAGLALWQGSSAADGPGLSLPVADEAVEARTDDSQDTDAAAPKTGPAHSAELPAAATEASTVAYTYDDAGRLLRVDYGNGTAISYTYDDAGNLLRREIERTFVEFLPNVQR